MKKDFHAELFDEPTLFKLDIFRQYIRTWLPVFMSNKDKNGNPIFKQINFYDFFAGPGTDAGGVFGSPLIIQEEIKAFCDTREALKANIPVRMVFNDIDEAAVEALEQNIAGNRCANNCCQFEFSAKSFGESYSERLKEMRKKGHANLILVDQFGMKAATPEIVKTLLDCGTTDILFFISSSFINRFVSRPEIQNLFKIDPEKLKDVEYNAIHRFICDYYRMQLEGTDALIAPFSIKKGSNIYGVIFASKNPLGLEKFLDVCWRMDSISGSANYNIDNEICYSGDTLFPEMNKPTRVSLFEESIIEFTRKQNPTNIELYRFCLEHGFCASKTNALLSDLQKRKAIKVLDILSGKLARRKSFYLKEPRARVRFKEIK